MLFDHYAVGIDTDLEVAKIMLKRRINVKVAYREVMNAVVNGLGCNLSVQVNHSCIIQDLIFHVKIRSFKNHLLRYVNYRPVLPACFST